MNDREEATSMTSDPGSKARWRQGGQAMAVLAISAVALLALVALVVDGGNAFAQQRITQNAADAASESGAVVLMQRLAGVVPTKTGSDVDTAVQTTAAANGLITPVQACYTDLDGNPLASDGSLAADCASAAQVGQGLPIPPCASCPSSVAAGVQVNGSRAFKGYFGGIIGLSQGRASAKATARAGYVTGISGPVVPVTFPVFASGCDGTNKLVTSTNPWPVGPNNVLAIPLCQSDPGNVGWLDWTPTAGGASELAGAIVQNPPNPAITTPKWYYVTATGNVNSSQVQTSMDTWNGMDINLPIFSATCNGTPANLTNPIGQIGDCALGGGTLNGGTGSNNWYFLVGFAAFHLNESFINGGDGGLCNADYPAGLVAGGNGGTSCLIGYFEGPTDAVSLGASVGAGGGSDTGTSLVGVQLIR
jgi:Flp pilus assembly protein TadG